MKRLILVLLCCFAFPVIASHIVGGEMELLYIRSNGINNFYQLNLIMYFDEVHGIQDNKTQDANIYVRIYRVSDNKLMMDNIQLPHKSESPVSYTQPSCSIADVKTSREFYSTTINLPNDQFNDPKGYYVVWERCCRNYTIVNIFSDDPLKNGSLPAGQTFYLQFPPVIKDGKAFRNSSPHLFPPLSDFACTNRPYYTNFAGTDDDGDSLAYSLVTPLTTNGSDSYPPILPQPYPEVTYRPPYGPGDVMGGHPDLKINRDGFLTVTPGSVIGLFAFAVKCEEYRNGEKIGETRRDFQLPVVDCPVSYPPKIVGKELTDADFSYVNAMNVNFTNAVDDADRCIEIRVSDPDSDGTHDGQENITIKAVALNFKEDISGILPAVTNATLVDGSTQTFRICFDKCPYIEHVPYEIGIVAYDDACALPLTDTLRVNVLVQPPSNDPPHFTTADVAVNAHEGDPKLLWPIQAVDTDGDAMTFYLTTQPPFSLDSAGLKLSIGSQKNDTLNASLTWDPRCLMFDYIKNKDLKIKLFVGSSDGCGFTRYDTMQFDLKMQLMDAMPQFIITSLDINNPLVNNSISIIRGQQISLGLKGLENNPALQRDSIEIKLADAGGNVEPNGYSFSPVRGIASAETTFIWNPDCSIFQNKVFENNYHFTFSMTDRHCITPETDTITIAMNISDVDGTDAEFSPRNFISPNDDGYNDYFAMEGIVIDQKGDATDIDSIVHFPKDNCDGKFEHIRICNRWGNEIFKSDARDFRWYAQDAAVGVYYYFLKFSHKEYKGTITVRF